jgi:hypothetical protein
MSIIKIKLYARLVFAGVVSLEEIPLEYRLAVETEIEKIKKGG